jgi:putative nucleotidyltransferase with HDIG domain
MRRHTQIYVTAAATLALFGTWVLVRASPNVPGPMLTDALLLCCLAVTAEFLGYVLPRSAAGSIGFIPYFAAAIIVPGWPSVLAVMIVKSAVELWARRPVLKAVLNVSAHAIAELLVVFGYTMLGGVALRLVPNYHNLADVTRAAATPALVAFIVASLANNLLVTGAIALSSGRSVGEVLRGNHNRANFGLDFIAWPLVFVFAWIYAVYGAMAAAALWVPILGLRQVHRTNLELEQTNEELLELMVKSIEARDPYTSGHSRRVHQFSTIIARAIGLVGRDIEHVARAALLHDVGKIYEKYAGVLSKQDKLTPEEWAIIQEHPVDGANLVATMTKLRDLVPSVRHHHENWDGTGYPDRIAGASIPIAARIIRFADTIDAMTTERPYRRPLTEAQVRAEVIRCRGTQFDPEIADKLLASPLWQTLFAPASNEVSIAPLAVVGRVPMRLPFGATAKAARGA